MKSKVPAARMVENVSLSGSDPSKKNKGKVPKRIHKAEREKMKREHLNDIFLALAHALELTRQNNGKASILGEATRIVKEMLAQIECLKRENVALLSEFQYVTIEKNELLDENSALDLHIGELQNELKEKVGLSKLDLNLAPAGCQQPEMISHLAKDCLKLPGVEPAFQQAPIVSPVYVIPFHSDNLQVCLEPDTFQHASKPISNVSKPHARYPTPADLWPSQILEKQPESGEAISS